MFSDNWQCFNPLVEAEHTVHGNLPEFERFAQQNSPASGPNLINLLDHSFAPQRLQPAFNLLALPTIFRAVWTTHYPGRQNPVPEIVRGAHYRILVVHQILQHQYAEDAGGEVRAADGLQGNCQVGGESQEEESVGSG